MGNAGFIPSTVGLEGFAGSRFADFQAQGQYVGFGVDIGSLGF